MRILRAQDYREMPWKNGKGATREIATHPEGASLESFLWRVSMAQVNAPGPFSVFQDCDRILCVVRGGPLHLSIADAEPVRLAKRTRITAGDSTVLYVVTMIAKVPLECDGVHHSHRIKRGAGL